MTGLLFISIPVSVITSFIFLACIKVVNQLLHHFKDSAIEVKVLAFPARSVTLTIGQGPVIDFFTRNMKKKTIWPMIGNLWQILLIVWISPQDLCSLGSRFFFLFTEDVSPWDRAGNSPVLRTSPSHWILARNSWLDKPARLSFSCYLDLLLISDQTNNRDIRDGNWLSTDGASSKILPFCDNFCLKQFYGEQSPFLKWSM